MDTAWFYCIIVFYTFVREYSYSIRTVEFPPTPRQTIVGPYIDTAVRNVTHLNVVYDSVFFHDCAEQISI
jgi:hypothetical protein